MSENKQFDRSKCFTFFNTYRTQGKRIREKYGDKMAADYYEAIIDYGLDQKPIIDDELMLLIGETLLETIDSSQKRRSRGFGENTERTKAIIELVRDNPGISQSKVASAVHCSKSTVSAALKNFREGKYKEVFDFNIIIGGTEYKPDGSTVTDESESEYENVPESSTDGQYGTGTNTNTNYNINNNINSTERYQYHSVGSRNTVTVNMDADASDASLDMVAKAPDVANAPGNSADAARLRLPVAPEWPAEWIEKDIRKLDLRFDGRIPDNEMLGIIARTYRQHINNDELDYKEIFIEMVKEFTGGTFNCNKDEVKKVCAYICGVPETTFVPRVDPNPDDLSSDTDTVDSGSDSPDLADSGLTDPSTDMVSTDITDSDSVTDSASDSSADLAPSDITVPSDTKDSSTVVPINQDNTDISGSNPGDAA